MKEHMMGQEEMGEMEEPKGAEGIEIALAIKHHPKKKPVKSLQDLKDLAKKMKEKKEK